MRITAEQKRMVVEFMTNMAAHEAASPPSLDPALRKLADFRRHFRMRTRFDSFEHGWARSSSRKRAPGGWL
jgi:hypothetical protein